MDSPLEAGLPISRILMTRLVKPRTCDGLGRGVARSPLTQRVRIHRRSLHRLQIQI